MLKKVDHLYHCTHELKNLCGIIENGFYPSYAQEHLGTKTVLVPMVTFSNILLRDVGKDEVLSYGSYGLGFTRQWAIDNGLNPVLYTFDEGLQYNVVQMLEEGINFLHLLERYQPDLEHMSLTKLARFSDSRVLPSLPPGARNILDLLSTQYSEDLYNAMVRFADASYRKHASVAALTKPYIVLNRKGEECIAYNDREWRKIYMGLNVLIEGSPCYEKWIHTDKPHYKEPAYTLTFTLEELKVVTVNTEDEVAIAIASLEDKFGKDEVDKRIQEQHLIVGTMHNLATADL